jgi:competence protein ComEA
MHIGGTTHINNRLPGGSMRALLLSLALVAIAALPNPAAAQQGSSPKSPAARSTKASLPSSPVNLNTATEAQLETLPGIGAKGAQRILEFRQKNGGFKKIEDLMNVKGIGEKNFLKLKPYITVGTQKTDPPAGK